MSLGPQIEPRGPRHVVWEGEEYLFFGGNDYHRLAFHPEVVEAACAAAHKWGLNVSGSRSTSANHPLYEALEDRLSRYLGAEAACVLSTGYMSNAILLQAIADSFTHLLIDAKAHSSLVDAAMATRHPHVVFDHLSMESLEKALANLPSRASPLVLTDGIFASTGEIAPLAEIHALSVSIVADDAHGIATVGSRGKGSWSECGIGRDRFYQTGTLSKGLGSFGGLIAADKQTIDLVKSRSSAFTGGTPIPLPMAAAAIKSLEILEREPSMAESLRIRSLKVKRDMLAGGVPVREGPSPICSVTFADATRNRILYERLKANRIYPNFVNYPGSPPGGHFRLTLSSAHTEEDIERLLSALREAVRLVEV